MPNAIGSASLVLSTNATKLYSGLKDATGKAVGMVGELKGKVEGKLSGLFGGGIKFAAGMAVFQGVSSLVTGAISKFGELKDSIDASAKAARRLGISTETFQGLQHAASLSGVKAEQFGEALNKLRGKVAGPLDEALYGLADRYAGMTDPLQRAKLLTEQFGETGIKLSSLFEGGKDGLKDMVAEAKKLGFALSDKDAALVEKANDSMERAKKSIEGLWQKVVVALAPAFEFWGKIITKVMAKLAPVFDWISRALDAYYTVASAVIEEVIMLVEEAISTIGQWTESIFGSADSWPTIQEVVTSALKAIAKAGAYAWDAIKAGVGAVAIAIGYVVEHVFTRLVGAFHEVAKLAKNLPDSIRPTWVDGFVDGVGRARAAVDAGGKGMQDWGKRQINGFGQSAARVDAWFAKLGKKRVEDVKAEVAELNNLADPKYTAVGAALEGSKEAYSIEARFKTEVLFKKDKEAKQLEAINKTNELLRHVVGAVSGIKLPILGAF